MQEFLYRIRPTRSDMLAAGPTEAEGRIIDDHFSYLSQKLRKESFSWQGGL